MDRSRLFRSVGNAHVSTVIVTKKTAASEHLPMKPILIHRSESDRRGMKERREVPVERTRDEGDIVGWRQEREGGRDRETMIGVSKDRGL